MKVLIVDDSRVSRQLLAQLIQDLSSDYKILESAVDGKDGYEKFLQLEPDLVISDFEMPNMNGLELLDLIRENNDSTHVIMLTAIIDERMKQKLQKYKNVDVLNKPLKHNLFKDLLENKKLLFEVH